MTVSREAYFDLVKENDRLREELDAQAAAHSKDILTLQSRLLAMEQVVSRTRQYLNASSRLYVESGHMVTAKARAKAALLDALTALDALPKETPE